MNREVFLTGYSIRLPGIEQLSDMEMLLDGEKDISQKTIKQVDGNRMAEFGDMEFSPETAFYPQRQDAKIMRKDVLASTICAGELMEKMRFPEMSVPDIPLFISGGIFVENIFGQTDKTAEAFKKAINNDDKVKMREMLYKAIPPLLALNTLTNAASSYVAQYSKLAGRNTTLGNTSLSGAQALSLAHNEIAKGLNDVAVAGAGSRGEMFSFLAFNRFIGGQDTWSESVGACLLAISDESFCEKQNQTPLCRIDEIVFSRNVPSLVAKTDFNQISFSNDIKDVPLVIFSGAFTPDSMKKQETLFKNLCSGRVFSWFPYLGNTGPVNMMLALLSCTVFMRKYNISSAACVDVDPYNRQSMIKISLP
jgi:hypothetical protein